jgi:hypothetical protein
VAKNDILTYEQVRKMFDYDKDTGILTWKMQRTGYKKDKQISNNSKNGYLVVYINEFGLDVSVHAHRLIWLWYYGAYPLQQVDHINGIRDDNRICNLRDVTARENTHNRKEHRAGKKPGVFYNKWEQRWDARIFYNGKQYRLGMYDTEELSLQAYNVALEEINAGHLPIYHKQKNKYRRFMEDTSVDTGQRHNYGKKLLISQKMEN